MSSYDIAIGVDESNLNRIIAWLFEKPVLRSKLFSGSQSASLGGVEVTVSWELQEPPTLKLTSPSAEQWAGALKEDAQTPQPMENSLLLTLPRLKVMRRKASSELQEGMASIQVICTLGLRGNEMALEPLAVIVDLSQASPLDQALYKTILIPRLLRMARTLLSGKQLPSVNVHGLQFSPAALAVVRGQVVAVTNLPGKPPPGAPSPDGLPDKPFYVLLSREAMQQAIKAGTQGFTGKSHHESGQRSSGPGSANYHAGIQIHSVTASPVLNDLTQVEASLGISASANADVQLDPLPKVGLSYEARPQPPTVAVRFGLSFADTTLRASVNGISHFIVTLEPTGNAFTQALSGIVWPLAQFLGVLLPSLGNQLFNGLTFPVMALASSSLEIEGVKLTVTPSAQSLSQYGDMLMVQGQMACS